MWRTMYSVSDMGCQNSGNLFRQPELCATATPPNKWLQLTAEIVTPFASAKGAPISSAAEPVC
jgi:hypothetical protein